MGCVWTAMLSREARYRGFLMETTQVLREATTTGSMAYVNDRPSTKVLGAASPRAHGGYLLLNRELFRRLPFLMTSTSIAIRLLQGRGNQRTHSVVQSMEQLLASVKTRRTTRV
eukprot:3242418-Pleurochrysis_carterae.AAC.1